MSDTPLVVESTSRFALALYDSLGKGGDNLFFSPAGIAIALTMASAGAQGETAREMAEVLCLPDLPPARLHAAMGFLLADFSFEYAQPDAGFPIGGEEEAPAADPTACLVRMANALWVCAGLHYHAAYRHVLRSFYESELHTVDFAADPEHARATVNAWVAERTRDKIPQLLPPGVLDAFTQFVITNAVYFKAQWDEPFVEHFTEPSAFHLAGGGTGTVPMMRQTDAFGYAEDERVQVLELPYTGDRFAMLIVLPRERNGLAATEAALSFEGLGAWRAALSPALVHARLPKFEFRRSLQLGKVLTSLGMRLAFSEAADFYAITDEIPLMIGQVLHEAFINLDEKGTEAAAATAVLMTLGAAEAPDEPPEPIQFIADHPFLFAITERASGALLFLGRVHDPRAG